jgi:hypothetical protein
MKKVSMSVVLAVMLAVMVFGSALAAPGGTPGAHGMSGKDFGAAVSGLAQSAPGAIAEHVSNSGGNGGGMPAAHGVSGKDFGAAVSGLAQSAPGAIAEHVSGK